MQATVSPCPLIQPPASLSGIARHCVGIGWRHAHYRELIERQPALDFLEVHSENFFGQGGAALAVLQRGRQDYAVSLHGVGLSLGSACGLDPWHLDQLALLVEKIEPLRVSDHACFARGHLARRPLPNNRELQPDRLMHAADLLPIPFSHEALDVLSRHVEQVQDRLKRRFMVENLSAYVAWPTPEHELFGPEADFLTELTRRTGCALLVDVNNLYVNARNAQINGLPGDPLLHCQAWLDNIPAVCVGEIHLGGHVHLQDAHGEIVIDDHGSKVTEAVWQLYRHALARFGNVPTLIEWDTDVPALDVLLDEAGRARAAQIAHVRDATKTGGATQAEYTLAPRLDQPLDAMADLWARRSAL